MGPQAESSVTIAALQAVFAHFSGSPTETLVLLALADRADKETWECYPSIADTAARTNLCPRTVKASLKRLEESGVIECIRFGGVSGSRGGLPTNRYRIMRSVLMPDGAPRSPSDSAGDAPWDGAGDSPSATPRCISRPLMGQLTPCDGAGAAPESRDEPSKDLRAAASGSVERGRPDEVECPRCNGNGRESDATDCQLCGGIGVNPAFRFRKRRY